MIANKKLKQAHKAFIYLITSVTVTLHCILMLQTVVLPNIMTVAIIIFKINHLTIPSFKIL